jgi:uncharacterized protein
VPSKQDLASGRHKGKNDQMKRDSIISPNAAAMKSAEIRLEKQDWHRIGPDLNSFGCAVIDKLLTRDECQEIASLYPQENFFRSHIHMARHGFGKGEYRYFKYPLPDLIGGLRTALYPHLAVLSNSWNEQMNVERRYPGRHAEFLKQCHAAGQTRPTPLLLQYVAGDFNCLHQDLYGDLAFPLQIAILLSEPDRDFTGGEFVITEQRPRMQSRAEVVPLRQGDAVAFAVHNRPVKGTKGNYRVNLRHGVSRVRSGERHTLGIIFHDAK